MSEWRLFEWRLFDPSDPPACSTAAWYADREHAPHLEQEGHRERLHLTARYVAAAIQAGGRDVCDLGAGDGGLLQLIREQIAVPVDAWGYDLQPTNVSAAAARGVNVELADFTTSPVRVGDVVVVTEVLEHLLDPRGLLERLAAMPGKPRWVVASSPYTETPDDHYEHHLWAWDRDGYETMLRDSGWTPIASDTAWICQVVLAKRSGP